jgi:hypothetical protein
MTFALFVSIACERPLTNNPFKKIKQAMLPSPLPSSSSDFILAYLTLPLAQVWGGDKADQEKNPKRVLVQNKMLVLL